MPLSNPLLRKVMIPYEVTHLLSHLSKHCSSTRLKWVIDLEHVSAPLWPQWTPGHHSSSIRPSPSITTMNDKPFTIARIPLNNLTYWIHVIKICLKSVIKFSTIYNPNFVSRVPSYTCSLSILPLLRKKIMETLHGCMAIVSESLPKIIHMGALQASHGHSVRISAPPTMPFNFIRVTVKESMQFHMARFRHLHHFTQLVSHGFTWLQ